MPLNGFALRFLIAGCVHNSVSKQGSEESLSECVGHYLQMVGIARVHNLGSGELNILPGLKRANGLSGSEDTASRKAASAFS